VVLGIVLTLGLWPFHAPHNDVAWLRDQNGLRFGPSGSVMSSAAFHTDVGGNGEMSLEIWFRPRRIWDSGTFVSICEYRNLSSLSLRQSQTTLFLRTNAPSIRSPGRTAVLSLEEAFTYANHPVFLSIAAGGQETNVYINGALVKASSRFPLSAENLTGRLILGDSPGQSDSWAGEIRGLAIYYRKLTGAEVLAHYATWVKAGHPAISGNQRNIALYLFGEHEGNVVRDAAGSGVNLYIPKTYQVVGKIALEPFWSEFEMTRSYWAAAFKNIVGFIPLGFSFYACLKMLLPEKRVGFLTVALGTAVSLVIEILQAFLPTRDSGTTDIITNTLGTWVGVALYRISAPVMFRLLARWRVPVPKGPSPD